VLVGVVFIPLDSADDAGKTPKSKSSFAQAIKIFRNRSGRVSDRNENELLERVFVALYEVNPPTSCSLT